jgi:pimeloyl-ACP methyl ester carboxylesterase
MRKSGVLPGMRILVLAFVLLALLPIPAANAASKLSWSDCDGLQCATAQVPLDYDQPKGRQISLALVKRPATDPAHRIGSLFTNPGGPGNSGVDFVRNDAPAAYTPAVLARFDVIGFDPRGVALSTPVRCFASADEQGALLGALPPFPVGGAEERTFASANAELGRRCRERNGDLLDHVSTANTARDLDQLRQAVGDAQLTYIGHSYGSLLGITYANLFPSRVRAVALDAILDPVGWTKNSLVPFSLRVGSQQATSDALRFFLESCKRAGERCAFSGGDPAAQFDRVMARLRQGPVELDLGDGPTPISYAEVVNIMRDVLGFPPGWASTAEALEVLRQTIDGEAPAHVAAKARTALAPDGYENGNEAKLAIACGETTNPRLPLVWPLAARLADLQTPYFGASWAYISEPCSTWPGADRDRYAGPFNQAPATPLLLVNARYDAAASYARARELAQALPGARLLTVEGAGHTEEVIDSACADAAIERYLIARQLPAQGATCAQDTDPFGE